MSEGQQESPQEEPKTFEDALRMIKELTEENRRLTSENIQLCEQQTFDGLTRESGIYKEEAAKKKAMEWLMENDFPQAAMIRMDMGNLKEINNQYTHEDGNRAIKAFGIFLKTAVETVKKDPNIQEALAFRLHDAGDEFGLFLGGVSQERVAEVMEAMKLIPPSVTINGQYIELGFTLGGASTKDSDVAKRLETLRVRSDQEKAAEIWNILNSTADYEERLQRRILKEGKED